MYICTKHNPTKASLPTVPLGINLALDQNILRKGPVALLGGGGGSRVLLHPQGRSDCGAVSGG